MVEPAMSVSPAALNNPDTPTSLSATPKDRRQYTCLCGMLHLRTATLLIGLLESIALLIAVISVIIRYGQGLEPIGSLIIVIIGLVLGCVGLACLFRAIFRQQAILLLPHIGLQVLASIGLLILAIVLSVDAIQIALHGSVEANLGTSIGILIVVLMATGLNTWFVVIVAKYYHFLRGNL